MPTAFPKLLPLSFESLECLEDKLYLKGLNLELIFEE